jgi:hypothetical protein
MSQVHKVTHVPVHLTLSPTWATIGSSGGGFLAGIGHDSVSVAELSVAYCDSSSTSMAALDCFSLL